MTTKYRVGGRLPFDVRFRGSYDQGAPDECWEWRASKDKRGYGIIMRDYSILRAHRVSYELHVAPIPNGKEVRHHCDNTSCVNPNHLTVGSHAENMADMRERRRAVALTDEQVARIRQIPRRAPGALQQIERLAAEYGVSRSTIYNARRKVGPYAS